MTVDDQTLSPCPHCKSDEIYRYKEPVDTTGLAGGLLPKLSPNSFSSAKMLSVVCGKCGHVRLFADDDALERLKQSKHWRRA